MTQSIARSLSLLATNLDSSGDITADAISPGVSLGGGGVTVYDSIGQLPTSGYSAGDQAFIKSTSRLYINSGVGWYNVAVINNTPIVQSILDSDGGTTPFSLATDGTPTTITITAVDSDGDSLTYNYSADSNFGGLATISQNANVFTITPYSEDSATTTSGTITFSVTDGINTATPGTQTFNLSFLSPLYQYVEQSIDADGGTIDENIYAQGMNVNNISASNTVTKYSSHSIFCNKSANNTGYFYSDLPNTSYTGQSFCVEFWRYETNTNVTSNTGLFNLGPSGASYKLLVYWDGTDLVAYTDNTSIMSGTIINWTRPVNQWSHYAATWDGSTYRFFQDGSLTHSVSNSTALTFNSGARINLNHYSNNALSVCYLDNIQVVFGIPKYTQAFTVPSQYQGQSYQAES